MTYKEAISLFRSRYTRNRRQEVDTMTDDEILAELSVVQSELQNRYMLVKALDSLTIDGSTSIYTAGTGASNIPPDIKQMIKVWLDDGLQTVLNPISISYLRDYVKPVQTPYGYTLTLQNNSMQMELDALPDKEYEMFIYYYPQFTIYGGYGGVNTDTEWSDVDFAESDYGGSLKLPVEWHELIVAGAIANALNNLDALAIFNKRVHDLRMSRPLNFSGEIPYDNSIETGTIYRRVLRDGQDRPLRRRI